MRNYYYFCDISLFYNRPINKFSIFSNNIQSCSTSLCNVTMDDGHTYAENVV